MSPRLPPERTPIYLRQHELALRWRVSPRTVEKWRQTGVGPRHLRVTEERRADPLFGALIATGNVAPEQVDELFRQAARL
jgi:hypothetical protein